MSVESPGCADVWQGTDFTSCFRDQYIANAPAVLAVGALLALLVCLRRAPPAEVTTASLVPPGGDNLAKLEARVLMSSLAQGLPRIDEPADEEAAATESANPNAPLPPRQSERVVNDFREDLPAKALRWAGIHYWLQLVGAAVWVALEGARIATSAWRNSDAHLTWWDDLRPLLFPVVMLLSAIVDGPIVPFLTLHLVPAVLLFRSTALGNYPGNGLTQSITAWEVLWWAALVSVPYYDALDRLLAGAVSHGGIGAGEPNSMPDHIEEPTSAFSRATYWFILPFLWRHYWKPITLEEIPAIREDDCASAALGSFRRFQAARDSAYEVKYSTPRVRNLALDLLAFFRPELVRQIIFACSFIVLQYMPPTGLRLLLKYITDREHEHTEQPPHVAALYVGMMAIGQSVGVVVYGQALMLGRRVCIRMRAIIVAEVFAKALRREDRAGMVKKAEVEGEEAVEGQESSSDGKVANLVSVDAFTISEICAYIFYLVSCPFALVVNLFLLFHTLGLASVAGVAVLVSLIPLQTLMGKLFTIFQRRLMTATDKRLDAVTEVISYIKLIKYNSWQDKFLDRMRGTRRNELNALAQRFALITFSNILVWGTPVLVTSAAFGVHVLVLNRPLTPDRAFASLVLFNMLRDPMALFQDTLVRLLQAYTSACRIQDFLNEPETLKYKQISTPGPSDPAIGFSDAKFAYPTDDSVTAGDDCGPTEQFRLGELDLSFPKGELSLVTGPVGSGKTTLILSLLGETVLLTGKVFMPDDHASRDLCPVDPSTGLSDTTAYCAQTAWLVGATIKQNIVFGSEWDEERYNKVVHACALERDFEIFDAGDETEVGEKGTTCSGGQKARIALARAIYSPASTIILDDVLSAVDAQTARHIFTHVLKGPLMKGRTCILVTHAVGLCLPAASFVVLLENGQCMASGTPAELIASGTLQAETEPGTPEDEEEEQQDLLEPTGYQGGVSAFSAISGISTRSRKSILQGGIMDDGIESNLDGLDYDALVTKKVMDAQAAGQGVMTPAKDKRDGGDRSSKQLVETESSNQGSIGAATYMLYFKSLGGVPFWIVLFIAFIGSQLLQFLSNWWVQEWSKAGTGDSKHPTQYYLFVYLIISGVYIVMIAARVGVSFIGSLHASSSLYSRMLKHILGAKLRFFDATPSGRIMNRLSKDMSSIDQETTEILGYFVNCVLSCATVLIVVAYSSPAFLIAFPFITFLYWVVGTLYVTTSREIKRYDSVTRSPIFVSFSEALVGMATIRSYADSARFLSKLLAELDTNTRCFWYLWQSNRVLNNLSNFVGTLITVCAAVLALQSNTMGAAAAGLSITYALSFTEYVLWVVRLYAAAEMSMNSVERVAEYLDLEQEEPEGSKGIDPPAHWPTRDGSVVVSNLTCKYAPHLDPVLRNLSFTIGPREKIGICGRTGSGKSTLALSFFRFLYQEGGSIVIDGQDIGKLNLNALRSRLTILPQEAQLFSGTIRDNMDPFGQHEDMEIWDALRQCGLAGRTPGASLAASRAVSRSVSRVHSRRGSLVDVNDTHSASGSALGLDVEVEERVMIRSLDESVAPGGRNFSQGQRQLLALARGLLKLHSSSFLIMDESTANLDHATDATIQNVLRTGLEDTQMLVIAHRLMTVCGLDKILVLDHGERIEFGTPWELLQDEDGSFRDLCRQSGEEAQLFELARRVHESKQKGGADPVSADT